MSSQSSGSSDIQARRERLARMIEGRGDPEIGGPSGGGEGRSSRGLGGWLPRGWPWATLIVCVAWIGYFILYKQNNDWSRLARGAMMFDPEQVRAGEWHRFISAGFVHDDIVDMIFNVWFFFIAGKTLERLLGAWRMLAIMLIAIAGGGGGILWTGSGRQILTTAATFGTIAGMMGSYFRYRSKLGGAGEYFGFLPIIVIYLILMFAGIVLFDPGELFGGMAAGFVAPFLLPPGGAMRSSEKRGLEILVPALVATALIWAGVQTGRNIYQETQPIRYQGSGWSFELLPGFETVEVGDDVEFRYFNRQDVVFRATPARPLIRASLKTIRERFRDDFGLGQKRKEQVFEDLPLGENGEVWVYLLAESRDGKNVYAYAASEESARVKGLFLSAAAPVEHADATKESFEMMIRSFRVEK